MKNPAPIHQNYFRKNHLSNTAYPYVKKSDSKIKGNLAALFEENPNRMKKTNNAQASVTAVKNNQETRLLSWEVMDPVQNHFEKRHYHLSRHCVQRASQRGIQSDAIALTLEFGKVYYRQRMLFHVLGDKELPGHLQHERERLRNTVVVLAEDGATLITAYRADNPFRKIRRKSKVLLTHYRSMAA